MSSPKSRKTFYMTDDDVARLESRAKKLQMFESAYVTELIMWDNQLGLIEACREGKIKTVAPAGIERRM